MCVCLCWCVCRVGRLTPSAVNKGKHSVMQPAGSSPAPCPQVEADWLWLSWCGVLTLSENTNIIYKWNETDKHTTFPLKVKCPQVVQTRRYNNTFLLSMLVTRHKRSLTHTNNLHTYHAYSTCIHKHTLSSSCR